MGKLVVIVVSLIIPVLACLYAIYKRHWLPFLLGMIAFTTSQLLIRIPIINYISEHSTTYHLWSVTKPFLIIGLLALSAGFFEEIARWIIIKYFLKIRTTAAGIWFGLGHGGIEAVILVGIPIIGVSALSASPIDFYHSGIERFCAIIVHVCLSLIVMMGVNTSRFRYCIYSILLHGLLNFGVVSASLIMSQKYTIVVLLALTALNISITYFIYRRKNNEKSVSIN